MLCILLCLLNGCVKVFIPCNPAAVWRSVSSQINFSWLTSCAFSSFCPQPSRQQVLPHWKWRWESVHLLPAQRQRHAGLLLRAQAVRGRRRAVQPGHVLQHHRQHHVHQLEPVLHQLLRWHGQPLQGGHQLWQHLLRLDCNLSGDAQLIPTRRFTPWSWLSGPSGHLCFDAAAV